VGGAGAYVAVVPHPIKHASEKKASAPDSECWYSPRKVVLGLADEKDLIEQNVHRLTVLGSSTVT
jgi:hypothetical protein